MMMSFFVFTSRASTEAAVLSLFSVVKKTFCASPFLQWLPDCCYVCFPVHYSQITAFLFIWCEGVKQMQIGEQPEAPAHLTLSPSSCQSQIIASTTKRHGQFRNRFREIGGSNGRRHARFCAVKSVHEHIQRKDKKRALHVHLKDSEYLLMSSPWNQGIWKLQGFLEMAKIDFSGSQLCFPVCVAKLHWFGELDQNVARSQRSNTPVGCQMLSQSRFV